MTWMAKVARDGSDVAHVPNDRGIPVVLAGSDDRVMRLCPEAAARAAEGDLRDLTRVAGRMGCIRIETQGKVLVDARRRQAMARSGFSAFGEPSQVFEVEVAQAEARVTRLAASARARIANLEIGRPDCMAAIRAIVDRAEMMDGFELDARLAHAGTGGIDAGECAVLRDGAGMGGFVLVARTEDPAARELVVRWVAPRHRRSGLANLALMADCLDRARDAGVARVRFAANPTRHRDTVVLARSLGARTCGTRMAFGRDLVARAVS